MNAVIIGISSGLLIILLVVFLKQLDKKVIYGLILSGIGFLYVGFVWADLQALVINAIRLCLLSWDIMELKDIYFGCGLFPSWMLGYALRFLLSAWINSPSLWFILYVT
jgi:hypothetical protein